MVNVDIVMVGGWDGKCGVAVAVAAVMQGRIQRLTAVSLECISCTIARPQVIFGWELTELKIKLLGDIRTLLKGGVYMPSFILRVMSVSSKGLTVLKVSKILSNRNYCSNYSVICILDVTYFAGFFG